MKQIPNIEEVVEQFMMTWFRPAYFEALTPTNRQEQVIYDEAKLKWETCKQQLTETLHQQLQKAREDWLRSEIEKLEGQMKDNVFVPDHNPSPYGGLICRECRMQEDCDCHVYNEALTSIITRYKEELLELDKTSGL